MSQEEILKLKSRISVIETKLSGLNKKTGENSKQFSNLGDELNVLLRDLRAYEIDHYMTYGPNKPLDQNSIEYKNLENKIANLKNLLDSEKNTKTSIIDEIKLLKEEKRNIQDELHKLSQKNYYSSYYFTQTDLYVYESLGIDDEGNPLLKYAVEGEIYKRDGLDHNLYSKPTYVYNSVSQDWYILDDSDGTHKLHKVQGNRGIDLYIINNFIKGKVDFKGL